MKITFIRPSIHGQRATDAMEPLVFAILKSQTPADVEVDFYDERLEPILFDDDTDLAAITVETYTARRSYQIAAEYRARGVPVVMGGYHPTFLPEEAGEFADAVVVGDAEGIWEGIVEDARRGKLQPRYQQPEFPPLDGLDPDRSVFRGKRYPPVAVVQYGRGCRYNCDFCSIRAFYGSTQRQRPIREVVAEIERLGRKNVFLVDDNIFVDSDKAKRLFAALVPLKIRWCCQISIDVARDRELVKLLEQSGCFAAVVGFESLEAANLKQMRKVWNVNRLDYPTSIRILQDAGIMIWGTFVFGYDRDTADSFEPTVEFAVDNRFFLANFNPLTPTPRARLFDRLKHEGRLLHDRWWLDPTYRYGEATFRPRGMTADELTAGCYHARTRFNTLGSIVRRGLARSTSLRSPARLALYLTSNLVSRREIHAKQDQALGLPAPLLPAEETP